ncbi:hypothetical protein CPLU01_12277 [Colletotrichum plurivorum]|uniref:Uncharacterized protein n=1 Tax=Colletotrichum plurivorum TaxID=2175906 RepID=A0A8H6JZ74_9PEZI|nr:hypothetical protein CPLU01_12277 [Colletotrichum plurivorum]
MASSNHSSGESQHIHSKDETTTAVSPTYNRVTAGEIKGNDEGSREELEPKAVTRSHFARYTNGLIVHIPAVATVAVLIWLSHKEFYWFSEDGPSGNISAETIMNLLQFPAKLAEIFLLGSLTSIAMAMFRRRLIGGGVRFGFLTAAYRIGDTGYLTSPPFTKMGWKGLGRWEFIIALYLIFATIMSLIVGPASAILLVPTPGWFAMSRNQAFGKIDMPIFYETTPENVWPTVFEDAGQWTQLADCKATEGIYRTWCPAGGFSEIWNWAESYGATDLKTNLTFQFPSTDLRRELIHAQVGDQNGTIISTTPSNFFMIMFGLFQKYINDNDLGAVSSSPRYQLNARLVDTTDEANKAKDRPIFQPFVQAKCRVYNEVTVQQTNQSLTYPTDALNCFGDAACENLRKNPPALKEQWWNDPNMDGRLISTNYFPYENRSSVVLVAGQIPDRKRDRSKDMVYTCSLLASWVASNFSTDPAISDALDSSLNTEQAMRDTFAKKTLDKGRVINFDQSWFPFINPPFNTSSGQTGVNPSKPILEMIGLFNGNSLHAAKERVEPITHRDFADAERFLSKLFGTYLTEGIARTGSSQATFVKLSTTTNRMELQDLTSLYSYYDGKYIVTPSPTNASATRWTYANASFDDTMSYDTTKNTWIPSQLNFDFEARRYGFGTGHSRETLTFALCIMYIYLGVVVSYGITVSFAQLIELTGRLRRLRVLSVEPWDDLQDLLVLALRSPQPQDADLGDAGTGASSGVWSKRVRVRADQNRHLRLVLNDGDDYTEKLDITGKTKYY